MSSDIEVNYESRIFSMGRQNKGHEVGEHYYGGAILSYRDGLLKPFFWRKSLHAQTLGQKYFTQTWLFNKQNLTFAIHVNLHSRSLFENLHLPFEKKK